ncbi:MAG: hypothetical protein WC943_06860 [Elusimicrobiota bacterium]|jgi:hypothetical protein
MASLRLLILAAGFSALTLSASAGPGRPAKSKPKGTSAKLLSSSVIPAPQGWEKEEVLTRSDPYVSFSSGVDTIKARVLGGPGSRYAKPDDFLKGFEATTMGRPPEQVRQVKVAGEEVALYRHGYPVMLGDPHVRDPEPPRLAFEEFVVLPQGSRFFVLSWAHDSPIPDPYAAGDKEWERFLASFSPKAGALPKKKR